MKDKLKDLLFVLSYLIVMGAVTAISAYRALPVSGMAEFDRGQYSVNAAVFGMFFGLGLLALIGLAIQWWKNKQ